jgi:hypothetical protein
MMQHFGCSSEAWNRHDKCYHETDEEARESGADIHQLGQVVRPWDNETKVGVVTAVSGTHPVVWWEDEEAPAPFGDKLCRATRDDLHVKPVFAPGHQWVRDRTNNDVWEIAAFWHDHAFRLTNTKNFVFYTREAMKTRFGCFSEGWDINDECYHDTEEEAREDRDDIHVKSVVCLCRNMTKCGIMVMPMWVWWEDSPSFFTPENQVKSMSTLCSAENTVLREPPLREFKGKQVRDTTGQIIPLEGVWRNHAFVRADTTLIKFSLSDMAELFGCNGVKWDVNDSCFLPVREELRVGQVVFD